MKYQFLNIFLDKKELLNQEGASINPFLLENNAKQIEKIYDFYQSPASMLCVNGFLGTGKVQIVNYSLSFLSPEVITLKYNCFNSTTLDDILLSFFTEFKKLSAKQIISDPKVKTENFSQKINSYFSAIEKPFVIILDSFEAILQENKKEILDFILHLTAIPKIKVVLITRSFDSENFEGVNYQRITTFALDKPLFEKYLKFEKIKLGSLIVEEFYKNTRGYYFFTDLSLKIMAYENLSLIDFLNEFKTSFSSFDDFLLKKAISMVPATSRDLFGFLAMIRHPVSVDLLKAISLYDEEKINFLMQKLIITKEDSMLYIQDYFKDQLDLSIAPNIAQRIHQYIIDLYQTQLPLKPLERNILISRQTMHKEIEYHTIFLPKRPKNIDVHNVDVNYLNYSTGIDFDYKFKSLKDDNSSKNKNDDEKQKPLPKIFFGDLSSVKNVSLNLNNLPFDMDPEQNSQTEKSDDKAFKHFKDVNQEENFNIRELLGFVKHAESGYLYVRVIELCKKALMLESDPDYSKALPLLYKKIANAHEKIADYDNALSFYELAQKVYEKMHNFVEVNYIKLHIAHIFYETYRLENARQLLLEIINTEGNPKVLNVQAYLQLANLESSLSDINLSSKYYKRAIELSDESMGLEILSELYFKYALVLDDNNDAKAAVEYYEKCINLPTKDAVNKYLSEAYSNIATLYFERNNNELAIENYLKAYEIDEANNNYDGMYYEASKLATAFLKEKSDEALTFLRKSLDCAQCLNDIFYIASALLAIGDFFYDKNQNDCALEHYVYAYDLVKDAFSKDNIAKIKMRINDIRFRMGEESFNSAMLDLKEKNNNE